MAKLPCGEVTMWRSYWQPIDTGMARNLQWGLGGLKNDVTFGHALFTGTQVQEQIQKVLVGGM